MAVQLVERYVVWSVSGTQNDPAAPQTATRTWCWHSPQRVRFAFYFLPGTFV